MTSSTSRAASGNPRALTTFGSAQEAGRGKGERIGKIDRQKSG
jgi:hypothetical protein